MRKMEKRSAGLTTGTSMNGNPRHRGSFLDKNNPHYDVAKQCIDRYVGKELAVLCF